MTTTPPAGPTRNPEGIGIDPRLGAATLRAPAASKEDFCPQAILKFQPRNSFDYRVRYEPQLFLDDMALRKIATTPLSSITLTCLHIQLFCNNFLLYMNPFHYHQHRY